MALLSGNRDVGGSRHARRLAAGDCSRGHGAQAESCVEDGSLLSMRRRRASRKLATYVPKSPKDMSRLQRRLATAGYHGFTPALVYVDRRDGLRRHWHSSSSSSCPGLRSGWFFALVGGAVIGFLMPASSCRVRSQQRQKQIQNGLPDALDLLIVSLEAGLALDQALLKCSEELAIAYPALSQELQMINIETRAGKPRLEALKNFRRRTEVDDARSLVAMLVQTDRFGTSVAQALRTHAEESRIKRRQRAEEKAAKLSVKLIFPLVFCLLPAFFVVAVGPALIKFVDFFSTLTWRLGNMKCSREVAVIVPVGAWSAGASRKICSRAVGGCESALDLQQWYAASRIVFAETYVQDSDAAGDRCDDRRASGVASVARDGEPRIRASSSYARSGRRAQSRCGTIRDALPADRGS